MAKTYLVTGGLGFLGASLCKSLVLRGDSVRILDNSSRGSREKLGEAAEEVEIIEGDIRDPTVVDRAVEGVSVVCHLAYVNGTEFFYDYPAYVLDVAVKGMVNIVDACIRSSVGELILASSSEVYQTPPTVPTDESAPLSVPDILNPRYSYGGGKILTELMGINYGREHLKRVVIFRPHNVYGPAMGYEHVIPQFVGRLQMAIDRKEKDPLEFAIQGDGSQTRSFIFIDDFTDGLLRVIDTGEHLGIYHIGTMEEVSIGDLAERIAKAMGRSISLVPGEEAKGGTPRRCPDNGKLCALGFRQQTSLDLGLVPTVAWYREHPAPPKASKQSQPKIFLPR